MGKIAFIFPGQGAQYIGMGKQIALKYKSSSDIYDEASEALGQDMRKMIFDGDEETLKITENTQPAIVTTSVACLQPLLENGIQADYTAGLSLGEYTAHVASGTIGLKTVLSLVRKRGRYIQEAVPLGKGAMAAIIGLSPGAVEECCQKASEFGVVEPANYNCPGQISISGEISAVEKAMTICTEKGAKRAVLLAVSAPFHCSLLKHAGELLDAELEGLEFSDFKVPLLANVNARVVESTSKIRETLVRQVSNPVLWEASMRYMLDNGVDTFIEIGPGKVLSGFMKKCSKEAMSFNVEDEESLERTLEGIEGRK